MKNRILFAMALAAAVAAAQPGAGNVSLPLDEYNRLLELAAKPAKRSDAPPAPYAIRSAHATFTVEGERVTGSLALEGEVFAAGTVKAPLATGMILTGAQMRGKDLPLTHENGAQTAVLTGPSEFAITLEIAGALTVEPGRTALTFAAPTAGAARLTLSIAGEETLAHINPGLITSRSSTNGRTVVEATLAPGQNTTVWWATRSAAPAPAAPKETRFLSDVKTLISLSDAEVTCAALAELTVVQGEPADFRVQIPAGFQVAEVAGPTLSSRQVANGILTLSVSPKARAHQFLITMTRANQGAAAEIPLAAFMGAQRETGEVLIEGEGSVEMSASGTGGLRRMDLKETSEALRSMAHATVQAAFRCQKRPADTPALTLKWTRFPDAPVLAAIAQEGVATTLVTSEGRCLTEVKLTVKNQAQQFLKVDLPAGALILSADVAGEKVKPVEGADGQRVPLLRPGFRPTDSYSVSFVFVHANAAFAKSGAGRLELPKMDVPVTLMEWEVFLPDQYRVTEFGGDALAARLMGVRAAPLAAPVATGVIGGVVVDPSGGVVPNTQVTVRHEATGATRRATTDFSGRWSVLNVPAGRVLVTFDTPGFKKEVRIADHDPARGTSVSVALQVGNVSESVTVTAESGAVETQRVERQARQNAALPDARTASQNVADLQRKVVGVLPIAIQVPKAGASYRFVRALVVAEPTALTFTYRRK